MQLAAPTWADHFGKRRGCTCETPGGVEMGAQAKARRVVASLGLALLGLAVPMCRGQAPSATPPGTAANAPPAFDVAVIRPNRGDVTGHSHIWSSAGDGHFKAQNVTAMDLIRYAFALPETRIVGGPAWIRSTKWDMEARSDPELDDKLRDMVPGEARQIKLSMLQRLLGDRFGLKTHEETRVQPIYSLVVAKGGPKFQPSQINGTTINSSSSKGDVSITVQGSDHTLALLTEQLSRTLGRVVVDNTGLDGRYDLTLKWTVDLAGPSSAAAAAAASSTAGPSIFTAIQEQLGLKLKSDKGPVAILVIDHIDMPSAN